MGSWLCVTSLGVGVGYDHVWRAGGGGAAPNMVCWRHGLEIFLWGLVGGGMETSVAGVF